MTKDERDVLEALCLRPGGAPFRHPAMQAAVLSLAGRQLVCDPHKLESGALFTRITDEGFAALSSTPAQ